MIRDAGRNATASPPDPTESRSRLWLGLYALAWGGGLIAYVPLITLLLPLKARAVSQDDGFGLLSLLTVVGAVTAGLSNIAAGAFSDRAVSRGGGRRPFVWAGLIGISAAYGLLHLAASPAALVAAFVLFQIALNLMLAPLAAVAADEIPDQQKGLLGGLLGVASPLGALSGVVITGSAITGRALDGEALRLVAIGLMTAVAVAPFLLLPRSGQASREETAGPPARGDAAAFRRVWAARLIVQIAGAVLFSYLLLYVLSLVDRGGPAPDAAPAAVAGLASVAAVSAAPLALLLGWASDRAGARRPFLLGAAVVATAGLCALSFAPGWPAAATGYWLFACAAGVFLALQSAWAMQLLPSPQRRGRDLGLYNLTNTIPGVIAPPLAFALVEGGGYRLLFAVLAAACAVSAALTAITPERATA